MACYLCGAENVPTEGHHIFGGARRPLSERWGLKVDLCHWCHNEPPAGVHHNAETRQKLQEMGQLKAMRENGWSTEDFRAVFGKGYTDAAPTAPELPGAPEDFMVIVCPPLPAWL